jgi:hypothetical protein
VRRRRRNAFSPAQAKRERAALLRDVARELKRKDRAKLVELKGRLVEARRLRRAGVVAARSACRAGRRELPTLAALAAELRKDKARAKASCASDLAAARAMKDREARQRAELAAERAHQQSIRRLDRLHRERTKSAKRPGVAKSRRGESDDEVRGNLPPELVALFEKVKRQIKGSDRESRTEAFLKYADEHPDEEWSALEGAVDREIAALERRQAMANPKKKTKRSPAMAKRRKARAAQHRRAKTRPPTAAERAEWEAFKRGNPRSKKNSTSSRTEVRSPTRTSTKAHTAGNFTATVTGGAGRGATNVHIQARKNPRGKKRKAPHKRPKARKTNAVYRSSAGESLRRAVADALAHAAHHDPPATCSAAYWRLPRADRAANLRSLMRGSARSQRAAACIAKAEAARAPPKRNPMTGPEAIAEYERTHWGEPGKRRIQKARAADPSRGTLTQMGKLVAVTYRTKKRGDRGLQDYEHTFEGPLPTLAYGDGGLVVAGGAYTVRKGGITG